MPRPEGKVIGVELGINNLATTSNGLRFSGKLGIEMRRKFSHLRAALASKGTKGAQRAWRRLSGREQRIMRDINHVISCRIVDSLEPDDVIVMEDLKHVREWTKVRKGQRYIHSSWPFAQLQGFVGYKALERGISVQFVDPHYSSLTCSRCGSLSSRNGSSFHCPSHGYRNHADYNAAYVLQFFFRAGYDGPDPWAALSTSPEATDFG